jgi:4-diphosphocytidyl-2-C-methyl-D-erythritol kinase
MIFMGANLMLRLFSPAKVNLFLRVVAKRSDGYHALSSVFQTVNLGDILTIQRHTHDLLTCSDPLIPSDASNLVLKAVQLFRRKTGKELYFKIHLDKRIPSQAGLGGGSSNAATTLWACNQLAGSIASEQQLKEWSSEIGSDIPFFFSQGTAHCTGRGEHVQELPALPVRSLWIIKPAFGLSTPEVYRCLSLPSTDIVPCCQKDREDFLLGKMDYFNDLEGPAFQLKPELKELKDSLLQKGFETVLMSGSGSSLFCMGQGRVLLKDEIQSFAARFINRQPHEWYKERGAPT